MKKFPIVFKRGKGSRVYDIDGNEYIDYFLGNGPLILGHCHPEVVNAVAEQIQNGSNLGGLTPIAIEFAQKICESVKSVDMLRYTSTGTEAVLYAIRIARAYTGRRYLVRFEGAYHGHSDLALLSSKLTKAKPGIKDVPIPDTRPYIDSAGIPETTADEILVAPFNNLRRLEEIMEIHGKRVAAILVEPIQRYISPRDSFLKEVERVAHQYGSLVIFDEIVTGFRLAPGGAQEFYGVEADVTTLGKITGGGYPHGVVGGKRKVMEVVFDPKSDRFVFHAGTFSGNAVACVAGYKQVTILERDHLYSRLHHAGERIRRGLDSVLAKTGLPYRVSGVGPMWHFAFIDQDIVDYRSSLHADKALADKVIIKMYEKGVLCSGGRNYISAVHSDGDLDQTIEIFQKALEEILREENLC